jgi:hypothetical protein
MVMIDAGAVLYVVCCNGLISGERACLALAAQTKDPGFARSDLFQTWHDTARSPKRKNDGLLDAL